jgi:hypothetical protein
MWNTYGGKAGGGWMNLPTPPQATQMQQLCQGCQHNYSYSPLLRYTEILGQIIHVQSHKYVSKIHGKILAGTCNFIYKISNLKGQYV